MPDMIHLGQLSPETGIVFQGITAISVASAGDVNGDGIGDIVIGGYSGTNDGIAFVIFGRADLMSLNPATMTASEGFKITGTSYSVLGLSVASGDVNHDGFDDIVVGAPGSGRGGPADNGAVYIIFGKASGFATLDAGTLAMPDGFAIRGGTEYRTGWSVATADINGDGFSDVIAGSPLFNGNNGRIDAIFGKAAGFANVDLPTLASTEGLTLTGIGSQAKFGYSISAVDDLTGDGFADLIVVAPDLSGYGNEAVYFTSFVGAALDMTGISGSGGANTGNTVAGGGDLNGDGRPDFLIGANSEGDAGAAYVIFGRDPAGGAPGLLSSDLPQLAAAQGLKFIGLQANDFLGSGVAIVGDINGDGYDDFALGAPGAHGRAGALYVLYGGPNLSAIDLGNILPSQGFIVEGGAINENVGGRIAGAGDVNGDGLDDILIAGQSNSYLIFGMSNAQADFSATAGAVYVDLALGTVRSTSLTSGTVTSATPFTSIDRTGPAVDAVGSAFGDRIYGATDNNRIAPGAGSDIVYGMGGNDTISYTNAAGAVLLELAGSFVNETALTSGTVVASTPVVTTDYAFGFANAEGSAFGDRLSGTGGANVITPGAGADIVYGMGGTDTVSYANAAGAVLLDLAGNFVNETALTSGTVVAATAVVTTDLAFGFADAEGSAFGDRLSGTGGDNVITPNAGADIVYGMGGNDTISYANAAGAILLDVAGNFVSETALTSGTVSAATAVVTTDLVFGFVNAEGSAFGDRFDGTSAANVIDGMNGEDILYGIGGNDTLRGGEGDDLLFGGDGDDLITGGGDNDDMVGGAGADDFHWDRQGEGIDRVTDFSAADDTLSFLGAAFGPGAGASAILVSGSNPVAAAANSFLYDTDTGLLSFDADGAGGGSAVAIVQLYGAPTITTADFLFI